jgi:hypothetical protein
LRCSLTEHGRSAATGAAFARSDSNQEPALLGLRMLQLNAQSEQRT